MTCPKCNSENVTITTEQVAGRTKTNKTGCLWSLGRMCLIICTCGLWLLIGKRKSHSSTNFNTKTVCVCQNCGNKWDANSAKNGI